MLLGPGVSARLDEPAVRSGVLDRPGRWWLGVAKKRRLLVSWIPGLRDALDRNVPRPPGWRGENASTWARHVRAVGGFDERFTYGYEDADFGQRLLLAGVIGVSVRYTAPVYHLDHPRPWRNAPVIAANKALYDENRAARVVRTPHGRSERIHGWTPHGRGGAFALPGVRGGGVLCSSVFICGFFRRCPSTVSAKR